ncbi:hypothetical protein XELAEV_18012221mg [Xenopus laevis]|uniref:Uncharacterized protein n=1 Tax=Xenopus laevis TaxID=8355 RepID=A0A974HXY0_XENLA|nr:hypothetical protein XELAEV_18012221mg [Xenopus laevis]
MIWEKEKKLQESAGYEKEEGSSCSGVERRGSRSRRRSSSEEVRDHQRSSGSGKRDREAIMKRLQRVWVMYQFTDNYPSSRDASCFPMQLHFTSCCSEHFKSEQ